MSDTEDGQDEFPYEDELSYSGMFPYDLTALPNEPEKGAPKDESEKPKSTQMTMTYPKKNVYSAEMSGRAEPDDNELPVYEDPYLVEEKARRLSSTEETTYSVTFILAGGLALAGLVAGLLIHWFIRKRRLGPSEYDIEAQK